jgi:signal transduction histidine kinase
MEIASDMERLPSAIEIALFRVLQESLTNVHRHSGSESVEICLRRNGAEIELLISDRGRGLPQDVLRCFETTGSNTGVGLAGMRERVKELGGQMQIRSDACGTVLSVRIPIGEWQATRDGVAARKDASAA